MAMRKPPRCKEWPIAGILGDQQAALVGQTCFEPGQAKNTYGTGCFLLMNTATRAGAHRSTACSPRSRTNWASSPRSYALEGSVAITGALVQWLRDNLGLDREKLRDRDPGAKREGQWRRLFCSGIFGSVRAVLEEQCSRRDRRSDSLCQ